MWKIQSQAPLGVDCVWFPVSLHSGRLLPFPPASPVKPVSSILDQGTMHASFFLLYVTVLPFSLIITCSFIPLELDHELLRYIADERNSFMEIMKFSD